MIGINGIQDYWKIEDIEGTGYTGLLKKREYRGYRTDRITGK